MSFDVHTISDVDAARYLAKRERLAAEIEAGVFDGEIEYDDEDSDDDD